MNSATQTRRLANEAAEWVTRLEIKDSLDCRNAFLAWLSESPAHIRAFLEMTELTVQLQSAKLETPSDLEALRAEVSNNVLSWGKDKDIARPDDHGELPVTASSIKTSQSRGIRPVWKAAAAALALACLGTVLHLALPSMGNRTFATEVGEQRTIKLEDGSVITLNTRSRFMVHLSETERRIQLLEGEALFTVAQDPSRPFRVVTDNLSVQAIGTQFDVHRRDAGTTVSVIEGSVQVERPSENQAAPDVAHVRAGEEVRVEHNGPIIKRPIVDITVPVAWRTRRLVFHETPLEEVAAEFNRYNRTQIEVEDDFGTAQHLTGGFDADNLPALILFLERDPALMVTQEDHAVRVRKR